MIRVIKSRWMRWMRNAAYKEKTSNTNTFLGEELSGKSPVGIPRREWEINIEAELKER
jgi:hypothetical protein